MKKILPVLGLLMALNLMAAPVEPLKYSPSVHSDVEIKKMYDTLFNDELKGNDCFKRAYLWSYQLVRNFNARPIKVFFHYTDKFNKELDSQGKTTRLGRWFNGGSKIVWDFHVAPAVERNDGTVIVLDPVVFPGNGPMTLQEWVTGLAKRGEHFLKKRKNSLFDDLAKLEKKGLKLHSSYIRIVRSDRDPSNILRKIKENKEEVAKIKKTMKYIGISENGETAPLTCSEVTHIETVDKNQENAWCFYQKTSMYYYAVGELRVLNYGTLGNHAPGQLSSQGEINAIINSTYRYPVNEKNLVTAKYFENGNTIYRDRFYDDGANYRVDGFLDFYLESSLDEITLPFRPELADFKRTVKLKDPEAARR